MFFHINNNCFYYNIHAPVFSTIFFQIIFPYRSQKRKPFSADYLYHIKKGLFLYSLFQTVKILIPWFRFVVFFLFLG